MQSSLSVIKKNQDGIEFFTHAITGESGMSHAGLARLTGVTHQSVGDLLKNISEGKVKTECLQKFLGKDVWMDARGFDNDRVVKDRVCAAVIDYYAFESERISSEARTQSVFAHRKFAEIGVRTWIQGITGWHQKTTDYSVEDFVMDAPLIWDREAKPFQPEFYEHLYRIRGWDINAPNRKGHPGCVGTWINKMVYEKFPEGVPTELAAKYKGVDKKRKKYEFLTLDQGRTHLEKHMSALMATLRISPSNNWKKFLSNLEKAIPDANAIRMIQLEFSLLSELEGDDEL